MCSDETVISTVSWAIRTSTSTYFVASLKRRRRGRLKNSPGDIVAWDDLLFRILAEDYIGDHKWPDKFACTRCYSSDMDEVTSICRDLVREPCWTNRH